MKKFLLFCLSTIFSLATWAAYDFSDDSSGTTFYYNITSDTEVEVTWGGRTNASGTSSYTGSIIIPETVLYEGTTYNVTSIGSYAFAYSRLTSVIIPDNIITIGDEAFEDCEYLSSVSIGSGVTSIGEYAFFMCVSLTSIEVPDNVSSIGVGIFEDCFTLSDIKLSNQITKLPQQAFALCTRLRSLDFLGTNVVTEIGDEAFAYCDGFTDIVIPEGVVSIGDWAFEVCSYLTSVTIPASLTTIGSRCFVQSLALEKFIVADGSESFCAEEGYNALYTKDMKTLIVFPPAARTLSYDIPEGVVTIRETAFSHCTSLGLVSIPNTVTSMGDYAFSYCEALTRIDIPNSVTSVDNFVFKGCMSLAEVTIGSGLTELSREMFSGCSSLTSIDIPENITTIGTATFDACSMLKHVEIPDNVTSVGQRAFQQSGLESIVFGKGLEKIEYATFDYCQKLVDVDLGNVKTICEAAFEGCFALTEVTIPNSVTTIEDAAFIECTGLETATIGSGVTTLGGFVFDYCENLSSITILCPQPPKFVYVDDGYLFEECGDVVVYLPAGTLDVYEEEFFNKFNIFGGIWGKGSYEELDYGVIKIDMEEEGKGYATYYNADYDVTLPSGVTAYTTSSLTTENGDNMLIMDKVEETIPAGVAVVVRGAVGTYTAPAVSSEASSSEGYLHSNSTSTTTTSPDGGDYYFYKLSDEDGVGFYWQDSTGGAFTIAANQAWLAVPQTEAEGINALYMYFEDEPVDDGIGSPVNTDNQNTDIYTLSGIKVKTPTKGGVYIVGGKKVLVK